MNKKILIFGIIALVVAMFIWKIKDNPSLKTVVWGIKIDTGGLRVVDSYKEDNGANSINWIDAESDNIKLFVGKATPESHDKFINDKVYLLESLFEPVKSPYPEVLTNIIVCPQEFKPKLLESSQGKIYKLFAGARLAYGVCVKDLVKYDSYYGIFDCGKKGVFEVKVFGQVGDSNIEKVMRSFSCT